MARSDIPSFVVAHHDIIMTSKKEHKCSICEGIVPLESTYVAAKIESTSRQGKAPYYTKKICIRCWNNMFGSKRPRRRS